MSKETWYTLVNDDSGHEYVIPVDREDEWDIWLSGDGPEYGVVPDWADEKEGHFKFKEYEV